MTPTIEAGPPAKPADRHAARNMRALLADELPRVRAGALAWRNGLGALLAGLIGFGLIKGRTDVSHLAPRYAAVVGALLLTALVVGGAGALLLLRAAHGRPGPTPLSPTSGADPLDLARDAEVADSMQALRRGVVAVFACAALLTAAVGVTWYGPEKRQLVEVQLTTGARHCGQIVSLAQNRLILKTSRGQIAVELAQADGLAVVDSCTTSTR
ncbi:hypothetical protein OHB44_09985 [Micromonospora sp. NBC_00821]|uniref:hypothetical protein n=1 Tax=Micromonospora sp. NBC_00821 TaxID=2975977 RepID=UPI002ED54439|nr:hypothetical protein OHB44_09985 [Micromonospora sp. NBC_00821]